MAFCSACAAPSIASWAFAAMRSAGSATSCSACSCSFVAASSSCARPLLVSCTLVACLPEPSAACEVVVATSPVAIAACSADCESSSFAFASASAVPRTWPIVSRSRPTIALKALPSTSCSDFGVTSAETAEAIASAVSAVEEM